MITDKRDITEMLLKENKISSEQLKEALLLKLQSKREIEDIIVEQGYVTKKDIIQAKAKKLEVDFLDLEEYAIKDVVRVISLVPGSIAKRHAALPIEINEGVLTVAMKDPTDIFAIDDLHLAASLEIRPVLSDPDLIREKLKKFYPDEYETTGYTHKANNSDQSHESSVKKVITPERNFKKEMELERESAKDRIGRQLTDSGIISEEQLKTALAIQSKDGGRIGEILVERGYLDLRTLYEFLEKQLKVPFIDLENVEIPEETVKLISPNIARRYTLVPIQKDDTFLEVAMSDPINIFCIDDLRLATGMEIIPLLASSVHINAILDKHYQASETDSKTGSEKKIIDFEEEIKKVNQEIAIEINEASKEEDTLEISDVENAPIVKMLNLVFNNAVVSGASDIHIEPYEDSVLIRYRIDGQLVETMRYEKKILSPLVARIKIISGLNIAEKRLPQDGRISLNIDGKEYDFRVSVLPTMFGEKVVIRVADKQGFNVPKKELGFTDTDIRKFDDILSNPHGIVLVTGPTGSGKSTTLYTALRELCKPNVNILTVEDPVECIVRGVNQVQVNTKAGLTFATALRAFLRQDPDIIMVGEIRDAETAQIATRAAITGHLVLSTLHTNDAASSITRMIDMGIEPYMISSSVVGVIAQRLVRRLCVKCREEYIPTLSEMEAMNIDRSNNLKLYMPRGCPACNNTGYKGRVAVFEVMSIDRDLRGMIAKNAAADSIKDAAVSNGMNTLRDNCINMVTAGITSIDEMLRVTHTKD